VAEHSKPGVHNYKGSDTNSDLQSATACCSFHHDFVRIQYKNLEMTHAAWDRTTVWAGADVPGEHITTFNLPVFINEVVMTSGADNIRQHLFY